MNILQTEEERIRRTKAAEKDLSHRFAVKMFVRRVCMVSGTICILCGIVAIIATMLLRGSVLWPGIVGLVFIAVGLLGFWRAKAMLDELGFMKYTLREYQDFLEKTKGKA